MNLTAKVLVAMLLGIFAGLTINVLNVEVFDRSLICLLYTSDAADE